MDSSSSVRLTETNKEFLENISLNSIKANATKKRLSYSQSIKLLHKYFKENNNGYLEFINWVGKNGI